MENYFEPCLAPDQLRSISSIGLAHIGDAVFEILARTWLCAHGRATGRGLHRSAVQLVCAESQARRAERILTPVFMGLGLVLCTAYLVDGSYNPFLYFRF